MSGYLGPEVLPEEDQQKWSDFVDLLNSALETVFGSEDGNVSAIIGLQFGEMGRDGRDDLPTCLVSGNLTACQTVEAVQEMLLVAVEAHKEVHRRSATEIRQRISEENVPPEVVAQAREYLESLGLPSDTEMQFVEVADTSDLAEATDISALEDTASEE